MTNKSAFEVTVATYPPLAGEMHAVVLENGRPSNNVIRTDQNWSVRVDWKLEGALVPCIAGNWCVTLFLESIGRGREFSFPLPHQEQIRVPLDPCGNGEYTYDIQVPAHTIRDSDCSTPYKAVVALTYLDPCDRPGPMAGFCELPILQFYTDKKQAGH
ncbi:hypothetical protein [Candidatus Leptofilum sp.]|uniref:hypothetical protein n=1 Tax=Candidatus Leptofilum sp. TaxID=3241576 RepID=UPI003B5CC8A1